MGFSVREYSEKHTFEITAVSYAGNPVDHSTMYITKKVEHLVENLRAVQHCLVFVEDTMEIPGELCEHNVFVKSPAPQLEYTKFVSRMAQQLEEEERRRVYTLTQGGYYVGENVTIGEGSYIEPGCLIGHDVVIGKNACIKSGARIKYAHIGDNFIARENCTVGTTGFTMAEDENGNKIRIPTLGMIRIGNNVEIGALTDVSRGSAGDTVLDDYVKIDALVHIGHDIHMYPNVEITAGAITGGFDVFLDHSYMGINSTTRNRITLGAHSRVSMGAAATRNVGDGETVSGNFAIPHQKFMQNLKESLK